MLRFDGIQHGLELLGDVGDDVIVGDAVVYAVHVVESLDGLIDGAFRCAGADVGNGLCQCHLGAIRIDKADVYKGLAHMAPGLAVALAKHGGAAQSASNDKTETIFIPQKPLNAPVIRGKDNKR